MNENETMHATPGRGDIFLCHHCEKPVVIDTVSYVRGYENPWIHTNGNFGCGYLAGYIATGPAVENRVGGSE